MNPAQEGAPGHALDLGQRLQQIAALLRLIEQAHVDLDDFDRQADVGWLIPLAAELAEQIAEQIEAQSRRANDEPGA